MSTSEQVSLIALRHEGEGDGDGDEDARPLPSAIVQVRRTETPKPENVARIFIIQTDNI